MANLMRPLAVICLCWIATCTLASAQTTDIAAPATLGKPSKTGKTSHRSGKPAPIPAPSGAAANLNAPSTDFSKVEPETGEPRGRRQRGPNVRPSLDGNGRPVMGLGF